MITGANPLVHTLNSYRIVWGMGGYGSGKTLNGFDIAYLLMKTGRYRYILSNCNSVWTDSPEDVVLRKESFVDAVVILDEGGLFMAMGRDARAFLLGLRKLNITIIVPSVLPPATSIRVLQMQRTLNLSVIGLPVWIYEYRLNVGSAKEKSKYAIINPSEIYGIYDTMDYPIDDAYLSEWFEYWMSIARDSRPEWQTWGPPPEIQTKRRKARNTKRNRGAQGEDFQLDELGGLLEEAIQGQGELSDIISIHSDQRPDKGRKKRL